MPVGTGLCRNLYTPEEVGQDVSLTPRAFLLVAAGLLSFAVLPSAAPLMAQDSPLVLEAHGGVAAPLGSFADGAGPGEGTTAGPSLALTFALPGAGWRALYAGFSQHRFGCEAAGCDADGRYVATGFNVGVRVVPVNRGPVIPWIRLGAVTTRVETGDLTATPSSAVDAGVSDLGFGGEVGVGILVRLGRSLGWSTTGLITSVDTDLPGGSTLSMRYFTAHTGLSFLF
ncbi:MAG: hypothetical protein HKO77_08365 [Gemmatimonadetes bacterium]|nr:hypothetical protein [Gemmatimonadota bacterium]